MNIPIHTEYQNLTLQSILDPTVNG